MNNETYISTIFKQFEGLKVLVLGDVMIDAYLIGKVDRISPEAPVPVVAVAKKESRLGGAANVALNLKALGATPFICAVCGSDDNGAVLKHLLHSNQLTDKGIVDIENKATTVKTRVISSGQQMLRIDEEDSSDLNTAQENLVLARVKQILAEEAISVIIFEDYNKGLLTEKLIKQCIELARAKEIPTAVDPKKKNFLAYKNVNLFKPNLKELREGLKVEIDKADKQNIDQAVRLLKKEIGAAIAFITLSENGVYLDSSQYSGITPAHIREIADVSGAGDTVISVAALCLALDLPHQLLAQLSNLAGGLVCEEVGVVPINKEKFKQEALKLKLT